MPARNEHFPWSPYYGHFKFFEAQMEAHGKVETFEATEEPGVYLIHLTNGTELRVFICECYSMGVVECDEVNDNLGNIDAIIINSAWCGYTPDAKHYCRQKKVGLYRIGEFMGALNSRSLWTYLTEAEKKDFKERDWL